VLKQLCSEARIETHLVRCLHALVVIVGHPQGRGGVFDEERVVGVARRVGLRLKERVEVPKRRLDPTARGHFGKAHSDEDAAELGAHFEQRVEVATANGGAQRVEVVVLERRRLRGKKREKDNERERGKRRGKKGRSR